jgi:hypothetical protein
MSVQNNNQNTSNVPVKKFDETDAKKIISDAQIDGIVTPDEREAIFQAGFKIKDESKFQELKQGISTEFEDISQIFTEGHDAGIKAENIQKVVHDFTIGTFSNEMIKEAQGEQKGLRKLYGHMGFKDFSLPDAKEAEIAIGAESKANEAAEKIKESFLESKVHDVKISYVKKEADMVTCVTDALKEIGFKDVKKEGVININEKLLKRMTGVKWDAIDISQTDTQQLKELLDGHEGKALVTDGGHAYVFTHLDDETGDIGVSDATVQQSKLISGSNVAATIYVQGKGDGAETEKAEGDKNVNLFSSVNKLGNINSADKTNGTLNESWQVRKLFVLLSDPNQSTTVRKIAEAIKLNDIDKLGDELSKKGIKLDNRELKAMATVMNARIDDNGKSTTMMDKFLWLNKTSTPGLTQNQTNYLKAVEYSNVDLSNYFSSASTAAERAKNMSQVLNDLIAGGEGC